MIEIKFLIGGKEVRSSDIGDALQSAILGAVADNIQQKLSQTTCPIHLQPPRITVKGMSLENLSFVVEGCCEENIKAATAKLKG